jgi:hypothetical protein
MYGYLGRVTGGLEFMPYSDIAFIVGLEYSNMFFTHQQNLFSAQKLGLNYGMAYKF